MGCRHNGMHPYYRGERPYTGIILPGGGGTVLYLYNITRGRGAVL